MIWHREAYIDLLTFRKTDRQMLVELFGTLIGLEREWQDQGATAHELDLSAFGLDHVPVIGCGGNTGILGGEVPRVLEDTPDYLIMTDNLGRRMKLCKGYATIALPLDFPVKNMDDWMRIRNRFQFSEQRIDWTAVECAKKDRLKGALVLAGIPGGFDLPRELMGDEALCYAFYDEPELIEDILCTVADTSCQVLDRISEHLVIDNLTVHEDMAGKSGPLIGPEMVLRFIKPYYRRVWDMLSAKGTRLFSQDSDGNMGAVLDAFLECGVNVFMPAEPAAGMDIVALRKKYASRLAFKGGIDKLKLLEGKDAIRRELEYKMQPMMKQGGVVFGLDHRIPNGVTIEHYRYYVKTAKEILGLPTRRMPWQSMAF